MHFILLLLTLCLSCATSYGANNKPTKPKAIIIIYADDLGYGDIACNGAKGIPTPAIDKLAAEGINFSDAHSSSAVCTPSRFALITGKYPWRVKGTNILPGDAALIIPTDKITLPAMLQQAGYYTGAIGKWHLGLGKGNINWNQPISPALKEVGFDESFVMAATADRVPCVFIRNGRVDKLDPQDPIEVSYQKNFTGQPTGKDNPELLTVKHSHGHSHGHDQSIINGIGRIGYMKGGKKALWNDETFADDITKEAVEFIHRNHKKPFFLYFCTSDIHVPRVANQRHIGKSLCGIRGDVTVQLDSSVQAIMQALKDAGLEQDSLVIFTSDNGPVLDDGYQDGARDDVDKIQHRAAGIFSGGKYGILEGGTRIPFIVKWGAHIKAGRSDALICQMDLAASLAALVGSPAENAFPDSENILASLLDQTNTGRKELVEHASGKKIALRRGHYKYIPAMVPNPPALYDLSKDPQEKHNIITQMPQIAKDMAKALRAYQNDIP